MFYQADVGEYHRRVVLREVEGNKLFVEGRAQGGSGSDVHRGNNDRFATNRGVVSGASFFYSRVLPSTVVSAFGVPTWGSGVAKWERAVDRLLVGLLSVEYNGCRFVVVALYFRNVGAPFGEFCLRRRANGASG